MIRNRICSKKYNITLHIIGQLFKLKCRDKNIHTVYLSYMEKDSLAVIIGDSVRAKVLRQLVSNKDYKFTVGELRKLTKAQPTAISAMLKKMESDGLVQSRALSKKEQINLGTREKKGYIYNQKYKNSPLLQNLIFQTMPNGKETLLNKLSRTPGVRCVIAAGIFADGSKSPADIVIAGDNVDESVIQNIIKTAEETLGTEVRFVLMSINDFAYRVQIQDKFIRSIIDYPHDVISDTHRILSPPLE